MESYTDLFKTQIWNPPRAWAQVFADTLVFINPSYINIILVQLEKSLSWKETK